MGIRREVTEKPRTDTILTINMAIRPAVIKQTQTVQLQAMTSMETKQVLSKKIHPAKLPDTINTEIG